MPLVRNMIVTVVVVVGGGGGYDGDGIGGSETIMEDTNTSGDTAVKLHQSHIVGNDCN